MTDTPAGVPAPAPEAPALEWHHQPWRDAPGRAIAGLLAAVSLGVLAVRTAPVPLAGWALLVASLVALGPAYLPAACRVDAGGVSRRVGFGWERRAWSAIRRARLGAHGLYVSSLAHGGPLEPFRGLLLPVPRDAAPALREALRNALEAHGH